MAGLLSSLHQNTNSASHEAPENIKYVDRLEPASIL